MTRTVRYAYLHGFASGPLSRKGRELARRLAAQGVDLLLPDLNRPSFAELTIEGALEAIDDLAGPEGDGTTWRFIGSSFGGFLAARWCELHPERVDRLLLLCPGFALGERWTAMMGEDAVATWRREGTYPVEDGAGETVSMHWGFAESVERHPPYPDVLCPARIIHGVQDEVVPIDTSRRYAAGRDHVDLIEVDDDHALTDSLDRIEREAVEFLLAR